MINVNMFSLEGTIAPLVRLSQQEMLGYLGPALARDIYTADAAYRGPYWYHGTTEIAAQQIQSSGFRTGVNNAVYFGSALLASAYGSHLCEVELPCDTILKNTASHPQIEVHDLSIIQFRRYIEASAYWRSYLAVRYHRVHLAIPKLIDIEGVVTCPLMPSADAFAALVRSVEARALSSEAAHYSPEHWRATALMGWRLLLAGCPADPLVLLLFSLVHDDQWSNHRVDFTRGQPAADLARELCAPVCTPAQLALLCVACSRRDGCETTDDPTIGACWDADELVRSGGALNARYLSTEIGRTRGMQWSIDAGSTRHVPWLSEPEPSWEELRTAYSTRARPEPAQQGARLAMSLEAD